MSERSMKTGVLPSPEPSPASPLAGDAALAWQRDYWHGLSVRPGLRPVIDPADTNGAKNERIDACHEAHVRRFMRRLRLGRLGTVLDFGCGIGRHHDLLTSLARRYIGVDIAEGMLARAPGDVRLIDGTHLPLPDHSVDCVFCFWVLQHTVDDATLDTVISEFGRCLYAGATAVLCERRGPTRGEPGRPADYIRHREPAEYRRLFARHGFRLRRLQPIATSWRWPRRSDPLTNQDYLYAFTS
ncbi:MAG: class I SAM-dependent methyltransferase [Phycisphaerales bacterium]|nr:class I SAM-dependent methyltransferase [Phycisphaerales bacterium]NNM26069.1 class I SAM-dependent methyltransferase [Phycisphaerales bacterium]